MTWAKRPMDRDQFRHMFELPSSPRASSCRDLVPNPQRTHAGWVTDKAHVLGAAESSIEARLSRLKQQTRAEVAWVVLNSIGDSDPHRFATDPLHHWGVGRKQQDDGVLVLHVLDRRSRCRPFKTASSHAVIWP